MKSPQTAKTATACQKTRVYVNGETFDILDESGGILKIRRPNGSKQYYAKRLRNEQIYGANRAQIVRGPAEMGISPKYAATPYPDNTTATACQKTPTVQDRIDSLLPDPRETAKSIHEQAVKLQREGKTYARAKAMSQGQHSALPWRYISGAIWTTPQDSEDLGQCIATRASASNIDPCTKDANMRLIVASVNNAGALAEALRDIRDCAYNPWQVAGVDKSDTTSLSAFAARVYSVANAALARWESEAGK